MIVKESPLLHAPAPGNREMPVAEIENVTEARVVVLYADWQHG